jgi:hypothetical protein
VDPEDPDGQIVPDERILADIERYKECYRKGHRHGLITKASLKDEVFAKYKKKGRVFYVWTSLSSC